MVHKRDYLMAMKNHACTFKPEKILHFVFVLPAISIVS
jgi:hypothetical protein